MEHLAPFPEFDVHGRRRENFDRIAGFQVALTGHKAWELPPRRDVVDKRVVQRFGDLMGERRDVLNAAAEDTRGDPAGIVE